MSFETNYISKYPLPGNVDSAGVGYIYIPRQISDIDNFIASCYNTGTISLLTSDSKRYDGVKINKTLFNDIDFPKAKDELGSMVFYATIPKRKLPIVVALLSKTGEMINTQNGQFKIERLTDSGQASVFGDGNKGNVIIEGRLEEGDGGNIFINAKSKVSGKGKVNINTDFELNVDSRDKVNIRAANEIYFETSDGSGDNKTIIKYVKGEGFTYLDEFGSEISVDKNGKFTIKNENYSLKELIEEIVSACSAITTSTQIGTQPVINKATFEQIKNTSIGKFFKE